MGSITLDDSIGDMITMTMAAAGLPTFVRWRDHTIEKDFFLFYIYFSSRVQRHAPRTYCAHADPAKTGTASSKYRDVVAVVVVVFVRQPI